MISKSKIFQFSLISFILGVGGAYFISSIDQLLIFSLIIGMVVILIIGFKNKKIRIANFCLISFMIGLLRFWSAEPAINQNYISFYNGQDLIFEGIVSKNPDVRDDHTKLTIQTTSIEVKNLMIKGKGNVLIITALYPEYQYGDQLKIGCHLEKPAKIEDFSYDLYLARYHIYSLCYRPTIELLAKNQRNPLYVAILSLKGQIQSIFNRAIPAPQVSILSAMILGNRRSIPEEITESFRKTGTSHIIAISGMHITIIAGLLMQFGIGLGISRRKTFFLAVIFLTIYLILVGMPASAVRAVAMGLLVILSQIIGRLSQSINPLLFVASLMILINPQILMADIGFQLSFLAVLGIIYLSPIFQRLFKWLPQFFQIRSSASMTMAAYLTTLPLIVYSFHNLSLVAIIVNVLILPVVPLVMITGLLTGVLGVIFLPLGKVIGWLVWLLLSYLISVINFFVQFDYAALEIEKFSWLVLVVAYLFLFLGIWIIYRKQNRSGKMGAVQ